MLGVLIFDTLPGLFIGIVVSLPLAIYAALQRPGGDAIALRLSALSVLIALAALVASELLARRTRAAMIHGV